MQTKIINVKLWNQKQARKYNKQEEARYITDIIN